MRRYVMKPVRAALNLRRYEEELNPQQFQAVTAGEGPHLVIAGAGSGKTRVVTYRVAYLVDCGIEPSRLLLVTFTNKAAREMLQRAQALVRVDLQPLWGGTFHHVGNLTLRRHAKALGLEDTYTILDREDAKDLLDACRTELPVKTEKARFPRGEVLQDLISFAVNTQTPLVEVLENRYPFFLEFADEIQKIAKWYDERKRRDNLVDYDDLLVLWLKLLQEEPKVLDLYATRFRYLLCDEYQDTNRLQGEILDLLASKSRNLMVVGDDAQSIYRFRGAHYENILRFAERYPDARIHKLEVNYRSTPEILRLANESIRWNRRQYPKQLQALRRSGSLPALIPLMDELEQAAFVAQRILELRDEGVPLREIAVLYRSHYQSLELQMELTRRGIPFEVRSGLRFFEQAHIKDVTSYLRIVLNPYDELSWKRALKLYPGIGAAMAEWIFKTIRDSANPLTAAFDPELPNSLPRAARRGFGEFLKLLEKLKEPELRSAPGELIRIVLEGGYEDYLKSRYPNWYARLEDLSQLAAFAQRYSSLEGFLSELALLGVVAGEGAEAEEAEGERLVLSTIHQAKGLEWTVVFLIWLAEGRMPSARSLKEEGGEEEERRLFYVAVTRAKEQLYLSYPLLSRDLRQEILLQPSRFIKELPEDSYEQWEIGHHEEGVPPSEESS